MHSKIKLFRFKPLQIQMGSRLFLAGLALLLGNFVLAGMVFMLPGSFVAGILATGAGDPDAMEKALLEKIDKKIKEISEKAAEGTISQETLTKALDKLNKEITKLSNDAIKELADRADKREKELTELTASLKETKEAMIAQGLELKKLKDSGADPAKVQTARVTFRKAIEDAIMAEKEIILEEVNDRDGKRLSMKNFFERKGKGSATPTMTIKAAVDMLETNITTDNYVNLLRLTELDPKRVGIPLTIYPHVMDVFPVKGISKPYMSLLVVHTYFDGTATKVEGAAGSQSSLKFKTIEFKAFFVETYFVLSDETLDDLQEALDEIAIVAPDKIMDKIDSKILSAAGDDVTDIKGIFAASKSTAYAAVNAALIDTPYIVDAIADAKLQVENAKYRPNAVYLAPATIAALAAKKNTFEDSKNDKRVAYDSLGNAVAVCGLRILQSTLIAADACLVFDNTQTMIGRRRDMTMEIGYNGTDMVEGQKTIVIKIRLAFGVRDKAAIVYVASIAAAIAALTKP